MRIPDSLAGLLDHGVIDEVVRPLKSGKEAQVYLVVYGGEEYVAKVYKESQNRSFQNRAEYTEGRRVRSSRDQRAIDKRSKHGRAQDEAAWRSAEVDMIYRLQAAGVRVPKPFHFIDGILIMELVKGADGGPAPRLDEVTLTREEARRIYTLLLREVVRMLCAGVVHGDLSDFNVLMAGSEPVVIDFPQAVNASRNQNARKLLLRDVENLHTFLLRFAPGTPALPYAQEMWQLYERGELTPNTTLSGRWVDKTRHVSTHAVLDVIKDAENDERKKRQGLGQSMRGTQPVPHPPGRGSPGPRGSTHPADFGRGPRGGTHPADAGPRRPQISHAPRRPEVTHAPQRHHTQSPTPPRHSHMPGGPRAAPVPHSPNQSPGDPAPSGPRRRRRRRG
jgi:RIO kinase 1